MLFWEILHLCLIAKLLAIDCRWGCRRWVYWNEWDRRIRGLGWLGWAGQVWV